MSTKGGLTPNMGSVRAKSRSPARKPKPAKKAASDYSSEGVVDNDVFLLPNSEFQLLGVLTALGCLVRLFRIYQPTSVVFDEVHFGGFASKYIKGRFFMDVHPPLAKLLITLAGWLAGFDGSFDFKEIGKDYLAPGVPYVAMRMLPAICGIIAIPLMYLTLRAAGCKSLSATMGALLVTFENGLLTQSRLILLDSPLVVFTAFTAFSWTSFHNQHEQGPEKAFGPNWWFWLICTGLGLGATVSVKWVGLFTIAWVGSMTLVQLWVLLGDTRTVTARVWFKHFFARAFCLIVIPGIFYLSMFALHFICLVNPGDGDGFMSAEFQSTLNSKGMNDVPAQVMMGSRVQLRHWNTQGGYLHSHNHMYPAGSKQQQITLYPHKDENNVWILENSTQPEGLDGPIKGPNAWDGVEPVQLEHNSIIRLYHVMTHRRLHSHDVRPPITEADWQNEVSAYGYEGFEGDANDLFRIEVVEKQCETEESKKKVMTIQTKFRLVHVMTGCALFSHKVKLPSWGFEQQEVTCAKQGTLPNSIWYVEGNEHPKLGEDSPKINYRNPGFLGKFWELQKVMWKTNAGLVESHAWDSRPASWPILRRGINFWGKDHRQIYLIGNPVIWISSTIAILVYAAFKGIATIRWQRSCGDYENLVFRRFDYEIGMSVLGWAFHYFPFFLMARQLFLHHYFPALYFAILSLCQVFDFITTRIAITGLYKRPVVVKALVIAFVGASIAAFAVYSPLAYGNPWTKGACQKAKLLGTWDFDCNTFHSSLAQYSGNNIGTGHAAAPTNPAMPINPKKEASKKENVTPIADGQPKRYIEKEIAREEKVEYRDQNGNLLNDEQVAALVGKVSFSTKYETRTRLVDADGNEVNPSEVADPPIAPPHPDVKGAEPETVEGDTEVRAEKNTPAAANADGEIQKESVAERAEAESSAAEPEAEPAADTKV